MKKVFLLFTACLVLTSSFASFEVKPRAILAREIFVPIGKDMKISLQDLSHISIKDLQKLTGKHLSFINRLTFKSAQKKIRNSINLDGTVNNKNIVKFIGPDGTGFNIGGFALGFFLGIIGLIIAYIINNDNNQSRRKWAWIGFGISVVIGLIAIL